MVRDGQLHLVRPDGFQHERLRRRVERAAQVPLLHEDPAVLALELDAQRVLLAVGEPHRHALGELHGHVPAGGGVAEAVVGELAHALDLHGARVVGAIAPLSHVHRVDAAAGHEPQRVIADVEPVAVADAVLGVRRPRGRAQPEVVVEPLRHRHGRVVVGGGAVPRTHRDGVDLADAAAEDHAGRKARGPTRPFLRAELEHAPVLPDRLPQRPVLLDRQAQRLLAVDVLSGADGGQGKRHVPVVGRGHGDGVDVAAVEEVAEIDERLAALLLVMALDEGPGAFALGGLDVAGGHDLGVAEAQEVFQQRRAAPAHANPSHRDAFAGRRPALGAQRGGGDHVRRRRGRARSQGGLLQEPPPADGDAVDWNAARASHDLSPPDERVAYAGGILTPSRPV